MPRATWNGAVLAESDDTVLIEGNYYFPRNSINSEFFVEIAKQTRCPWKGMASYYDLVVDGEVNPGAAWYYPDPEPAAIDIKDRVAFWRGVCIE